MSPARLQRFLIPGLAFKAVIMAGGHATGRELAEFFSPAGPVCGIPGMLLAMTIWSAVAAQRIGLVDLIAKGYPYMSDAMIVAFLLPLLTLGSWWLWRCHAPSSSIEAPKGEAQ